jgi:hypothetical protein
VIHAHPTLKLGRPGGPSTRHAALIETFVDKTKLQAPPFATNIGGPDVIGQYGNDRLGDCTCATWAAIFLHDAAAHGDSIDFTTDAVLTMYEASGYNPADATTDNGWSLAAAATYAERIGIVDTTGVVRKSGPFLRINHVDLVEIQIARSEFGVLPVGVQLPLAAQNISQPWDTDGSGGNQEPGSWGGHSLALLDYDHDGVIFRTWGRKQRATWRWWQRYVDEAICKVDPLWASGDRPAPAGFLLDDLVAAQSVLR